MAPRSSRAHLAEVTEGVLKVKLTAPPADGAANKQLIELMSKALGVSKSSIAIIKGHKSRDKVLALKGVKGIQGRPA